MLATFPESLSARAAEALARARRRGPRRNARHRDRRRRRGQRSATERLAAATVLWAAGVAASPLAASLGAPLDRAGRVQVEPDLIDPRTSRGLRDRRPRDRAASERRAASRASRRSPCSRGRYVARTIIDARLAGGPREPFRLPRQGQPGDHRPRRGGRPHRSRASSRACSPGCCGSSSTSCYLVGFRNRLVVLIDWAWAYVTIQRGARLITGDIEPEPKRQAAPVIAPRAVSSTGT